MKEVVNLSGEIELVAKGVPVDTVDGINYLLTPERQAQEVIKNTVVVADMADDRWRYDREQARGSLQEQWEYFIDNGYTALKLRDDNIKIQYPKGE